MNLLGSLGVNVKLLIAQIVNFGLLVWILSRFLYKPIIQRIEKDEAELKEAETQRKELEQQKDAFESQKKLEAVEIKKRTKEILEEAVGLTDESKKQAQVSIDKETAAMIELTKTALLAERPTLRQEVMKEVKNEAPDNFKEIFNARLSPDYQKEMQSVLLKNLIKKIGAIAVPSTVGTGTGGILKKVKSLDKGSDLEGRVSELLNQKIGPIVLEYVLPLSDAQRSELIEVISKKIGLKKTSGKTGLDTIIEFRQNTGLINGFRLEFLGMVVDSNFLEFVKYATDFKK